MKTINLTIGAISVPDSFEQEDAIGVALLIAKRCMSEDCNKAPLHTHPYLVINMSGAFEAIDSGDWDNERLAGTILNMLQGEMQKVELLNMKPKGGVN